MKWRDKVMTAAKLTEARVKKSFFADYYFYKLRSCKVSFILSIIFSVLCIPVAVLLQIVEVNEMKAAAMRAAAEQTPSFFLMNTFEPVCVSVIIISAIVLFVNIFTACAKLFSYNTSKSDADMYLSLPLTSTQRFMADFSAGATILALPTVIFTLIGSVILWLCNINLTVADLDVLKSIGESGVMSEVDYSFASSRAYLFETVSTTAFIGITLIIMLLGAYLVSLLLFNCCGRTGHAIVYSIMLEAAIPLLFGIMLSKCYAVNGISNTACYSFTAIAPFGTLISAGQIFLFRLSTQSVNDLFVIYDFATVAAIIVIFAGLFFLSFAAAKHRKAEKAGVHFVFGALYHVISLCFITGIIMAFTESDISVIIIVCLFCATGYFFMELAVGRKLRQAALSVLRFVSVIAFAVVFQVLAHTTKGYGVNHDIPSANDIVSARNRSSCGYFYDLMPYDNIELDDREEIELLLELQKKLIGNEFGVNNNSTEGMEVIFGYTLKNGNYQRWSYMISNDNTELINEITSYGERIVTSENIREEISQALTDPEYLVLIDGNRLGIPVYRDGRTLFGDRLKAETAPKLLQALQNEYFSDDNTGKLYAEILIPGLPGSYSYPDSYRLRIREGCDEVISLLSDESNYCATEEELIELTVDSTPLIELGIVGPPDDSDWLTLYLSQDNYDSKEMDKLRSMLKLVDPFELGLYENSINMYDNTITGVLESDYEEFFGILRNACPIIDYSSDEY